MTCLLEPIKTKEKIWFSLLPIKETIHTVGFGAPLTPVYQALTTNISVQCTVNERYFTFLHLIGILRTSSVFSHFSIIYLTSLSLFAFQLAINQSKTVNIMKWNWKTLDAFVLCHVGTKLYKVLVGLNLLALFVNWATYFRDPSTHPILKSNGFKVVTLSSMTLQCNNGTVKHITPHCNFQPSHN